VPPQGGGMETKMKKRFQRISVVVFALVLAFSLGLAPVSADDPQDFFTITLETTVNDANPNDDDDDYDDEEDDDYDDDYDDEDDSDDDYYDDEFLPISLQDATINAIADKAYTGKQIRPDVTVKEGGQTLEPGEDYILSYGPNKAIGKGTVTVKGQGDYDGEKQVVFKIVPQKTTLKKVTVGKKSLKVTWKKLSAAQKATKYEIRYKVKGTAKWKVKAVASKLNSLTIQKLKKGREYQLQIRSYKKVAGAKYYSAWSGVKTSKKVK
jgi:hypothetical protein